MLLTPILDISKAFDRVWHKGLLYKIRGMGINENFSKLVQSFLSNRYRCAVLNGQASSWTDVKAPDPDEVRILRNNLTQENNLFLIIKDKL